MSKVQLFFVRFVAALRNRPVDTFPVVNHVQDYSWEDHGFSLVNRLLPDMSHLLDEKFQVCPYISD